MNAESKRPSRPRIEVEGDEAKALALAWGLRPDQAENVVAAKQAGHIACQTVTFVDRAVYCVACKSLDFLMDDDDD